MSAAAGVQCGHRSGCHAFCHSSATPLSAATATPTPRRRCRTPLPAAEIPDETAGPYNDGSNGPDVLEQSGIVRSICAARSAAARPPSAPLQFTLRITDMANGDVPFAGVAVYAWHCNAQGEYSMYSSGIENETYLRGVQVTDADGQVTFTSIVPACSAGGRTSTSRSTRRSTRSPVGERHRHLADRDAREHARERLRPARLRRIDPQPVADHARERQRVRRRRRLALQVATVTGDATNGYTTAMLVARVDTTTAPTGEIRPRRQGSRRSLSAAFTGPGAHSPPRIPPRVGLCVASVTVYVHLD
ncbi:MAG: 3,4-dioxygenase subunit beta [Microbacterium sp.]